MSAVLEGLDAYVDRRRDQIRRDLGRERNLVMGTLAETLDDPVVAERLLLAFRVGSDTQLGRLVRKVMHEALLDRADAIAEAEYHARGGAA